jgi:hypothetical protein
MSKEAMKLALEAHHKNERHNSVAETNYWCNQYKLLAHQAIEALAKQEQGEKPFYKVEGPIHVVCQCDKCKAKQEQGEPVAVKHMSTEAMKLALEFAQDVHLGEWRGPVERQEEVIKALEEALAKQEQGEPVAWIGDDGNLYHDYEKPHEEYGPEPTPLYTTPQQRKLLTDEQANKAAMKLAECIDYPWVHMPEEGKRNMRKHAKAIIEAAHGIKE